MICFREFLCAFKLSDFSLCAAERELVFLIVCLLLTDTYLPVCFHKRSKPCRCLIHAKMLPLGMEAALSTGHGMTQSGDKGPAVDRLTTTLNKASACAPSAERRIPCDGHGDHGPVGEPKHHARRACRRVRRAKAQEWAGIENQEDVV